MSTFNHIPPIYPEYNDDVESAIQYLDEHKKANHYDKSFVKSLADRFEGYTEKQGKAALKVVRKYQKTLKNAGFNVEDILENEKFAEPLTKSPQKIICYDNQKDQIEIEYPFNQKFINRVKEFTRELRQGQNGLSFDENEKFWFGPANNETLHFAAMLTLEFNDFYVDEDIREVIDFFLREHERTELPKAYMENGQLVIDNLFDEQKRHLEEAIERKKSQ